MRNPDLVLGLATLAAGGTVLALSLALPEMPQSYAGPGLFPTLIGGGMMLAGLLLARPALRDLRIGKAGRPSPPPSPTRSEPPPTGPAGGSPRLAWRGMVEVLAAVLLFVVLAPRLGFVAAALVMTGSLLMARGNQLPLSLAVGLVLTLAVRWMFGILLKVPLPSGPWGW